MAPIKALLFDFDGVIADTESIHWKAWCEVLAPYALKLDWDTYQTRCIGVSDLAMRRIFCELCEKHITEDQVKELYPLKRKVFQSLTQEVELIDRGLVAGLAGLTVLKMAVVTSSNQAEVEPILRQAGMLDLLGTVVYGNHVTHYKPHPEPYLLSLARLAVRPSEAVAFEDSPAGIRSALEAGCHVLTVRGPEELLGLVQTVLAGQRPSLLAQPRDP